MSTLTRRRAARSPKAALALVFLVVFGCGALGSSASAASGKAVQRPIYWGALIGDEVTGTAAPWDMNALTGFANSVQKGLSLVQFSAPFSDCTHKPCSYYYFPTLAMQNIREYGAIPFFNWASQSLPSSVNEPAFRLKRIINGRYDNFIRDFAEMARDWGHPFFLRLNWEMNGFWFPWSEGVNGNKAGEFVAAWRHIHRIFTSVGATNATWAWCPNVDFTRKLVPMRSLYPGNKYVDWTCLDGFNWGKTRNSGGWMSFNRIFKSTYQRLVKIAPHKPIMIGEAASEERGGSKPDWIRNTLKVIPSEYPKVRGFVWFDDKEENMNWPLSSSQAATDAFAQGIGRTVYMPNVYSGAPNGPIRPPTWYPPPPEVPVSTGP